MMKLLVLAGLLLAGVANAASEQYYMSGILACDKTVVTEPNFAYCRLITGDDPAGLLYAINISDAKRPVVPMEGFMTVDPVAHMKILAISDRTPEMGSQCATLLVENDVITWAWDLPLVNCLKPRLPSDPRP